MTTKHLRFAPQILARLGEELNPHPDQGIVELVKNAYDADARTCAIELSETLEPGGEITITDDGDGMTAEQIGDGWLVLGRSSKRPERRSRLKRLPVGEKGLGRLAALRLGEQAELHTRPREEEGIEYRVELDWSRFGSVRTVDEVGLEVTRHRTSQPPGTTIAVRNLRVRLTRRDVKRLARALLLLADPFETKRGFRPVLEAPDFTDLANLVDEAYFDVATYEIHASVDARGRARISMTDHIYGDEASISAADLRIRLNHEAAGTYDVPATSFDLWAFNVNSESLIGTAATVTGLRDWLAVVGGVHIYHRGLRVAPYGDFDWLELNLRRVRSPEERPSTNTAVGRLVVEDPHAQLTQKTDRSGFIEDETFDELRRFAGDALEWAAGYRLEAAEERRQVRKDRAPKTRASAQADLEQAVKKLPAAQRRALEPKLKRVARAQDREVETLVTDLELYRTLGTLGTTTAVVAHESFNPSVTILKMADSIEQRGQAELDGRFDATLKRPLAVLRKAAERVHTYAVLPRRLLEQDKRKARTFGVFDALRETLDVYAPVLEEHRVGIELDLPRGPQPKLRGRVAALEAIVGNLVLNAVNALDRKPDGGRRVVVRARVDEPGILVLTVLDNGPGVQDLSPRDIWLPGRTSTGGTGLGLTIVRDAARDMRGNVGVESHGELGGATFTVELPTAR